MNHDTPSPFPIILAAGIAIDEMCYCGNERSAHAGGVDTYGDGPCFITGSDCRQFTHKAFVYAEIVPSREGIA